MLSQKSAASDILQRKVDSYFKKSKKTKPSCEGVVQDSFFQSESKQYAKVCSVCHAHVRVIAFQEFPALLNAARMPGQIAEVTRLLAVLPDQAFGVRDEVCICSVLCSVVLHFSF